MSSVRIAATGCRDAWAVLGGSPLLACMRVRTSLACGLMQTVDVRPRIVAAGLAIAALVLSLLVAAPSARADSLTREVHNAGELEDAIEDFNSEDDPSAHHVITIMESFTWNAPLIIYDSNAAELTIQGADSAHPPTITLGADSDGFLAVDSLSVANVTVKDLALAGEEGFTGVTMLTILAQDVQIENISVSGITSQASPVGVWGGAVSVTNSHFSDNTALAVGQAGALTVWSSSSFTIAGSTFMRNESVDGNGGAVRAMTEGGVELGIYDSLFTGNVASGDGGAVYEHTEEVRILRSVFTDNTAGGDGGAVSGPERVTAVASTFIGNEAGGDGGAIFAGIYFDTVGSTFSDNSAGGSGGAVYSDGGSSSFVSRSTFELNTAAVGGGAVHAVDYALTVNASTFVSNAAPEGAHVHLAPSTIITFASVFADAQGGDGCVAGSFTIQGHTFDADGTCTGLLDFGPGLDPLLLPLADNGGPTPTRMPAPDSPLVDRIDAEACAEMIDDHTSPATQYDQRDLDILEALYAGDAGCDIGAVERVGSVTFVLPGIAGDVEFTVDGALRHIEECDGVDPVSEAPEGAPAGVTFPYGLLTFCVDTGVRGAPVTITVTFPSPVNRAYKVDDAWGELPDVSFAGNAFTYVIYDEGPFDRATGADGIILDPLAPGVAAAFTG